MLTREDMEFFQQYFDSLNREVVKLRSEMKAEMAGIRAEMVTKHELREFRKTVLTYALSASRMFRQLGGSDADMSAEIEDLKRRVAEIERRLPPEAAA